MSGGPFVLADNQVAAANVTALLFPTASAVANFKFRFHRGAGINGVIDLTCWKDSTGAWNIFQGVDQGNGTSGLTFSLTTSGLYQQVQYTSTSVGAAGEGHWTGAAV
jgi:hypothetical protein